MEQQRIVDILVIWRGKNLKVEINSNSNVKEFGQKLQKLTKVKPDTMRLLVPQSTNKGSKLLVPFSDEHSSLNLQETSILQGKPIRMMGVFEDEIEEVSQNSKESALRIAGFDEEEERLRRRLLDRPQASLKLPQGAYIFCDFRTLSIPGIELNPPASEALRRMHMLACDPGIIAIMNKHRWRVGIMTEMAPVGYVGISPKCLLGFNKNNGEEISLRLRTDDLKGFRKYESIKKTLLHELAHMMYSEHDANFFALDKQLNQEAAYLDWTKSKGHTLSGHKISDHYEEEFYVRSSISSSAQKLGGQRLDSLTSAHASSVAAAYNRFINVSTSSLEGSPVQVESIYPDKMTKNAHVLNKGHASNATFEPDPDDSELEGECGKHDTEPDPDDTPVIVKDEMQVDTLMDIDRNCLSTSSMHKESEEPDPDDYLDNNNVFEPDPDDSLVGGAIESFTEPDPDDFQEVEAMESCEEPNPYGFVLTKVDVNTGIVVKMNPDDSGIVESMKGWTQLKHPSVEKRYEEPDPDDSQDVEDMKYCEERDRDDSGSKQLDLNHRNVCEPDPDGSRIVETTKYETQVNILHLEMTQKELDPDDCKTKGILPEPSTCREPDPSDELENDNVKAEPDRSVLKNPELQSIEEPVAVICSRLQKAIETLRSEVTPVAANFSLQTLFKIIRNVIDHPNEVKYRRLRKANPLFQRNVVNYKAAMEVLAVVGFYEDVMPDEFGRVETYLVLKRNDPGLLWLAKSSLEVSLA